MCPQPWEGRDASHLLKPQAALGCSGSSVAPCGTPWSSSAFPRPSWRAPGLPAHSTGCSLFSHQLSRLAGHQGQPHRRVGGTGAGPETALSPPHPWGPPHQGRGPCGVAALGTPRSVSSAHSARAGEQGGTPHSCLTRPWHKAQPSGKWTGPALTQHVPLLGCRQPCPGAALAKREQLSQGQSHFPGTGNTTQAKSVSTQFTPGRDREAAERAGPGSRTLGLPTQFLTNCKGGF